MWLLWFVVLHICLTEARYNTRLVEPRTDCISGSYNASTAVSVHIRPENKTQLICLLSFTFPKEAKEYTKKLLYSPATRLKMTADKPCWSVVISQSDVALMDYHCDRGTPNKYFWDGESVKITMDTLIPSATSEDLVRFTLTPAVENKNGKCPANFKLRRSGDDILCVHKDVLCDGSHNLRNGTDETDCSYVTEEILSSAASSGWIIAIVVLSFIVIISVVVTILLYRYFREKPHVRKWRDQYKGLDVQFENARQETEENLRAEQKKRTDLEETVKLRIEEKDRAIDELTTTLIPLEQNKRELKKQGDQQQGLQKELKHTQETLLSKERDFERKERELSRALEQMAKVEKDHEKLRNEMDNINSSAADVNDKVQQKENEAERRMKRVEYAENILTPPEKVMLEETGQSRDDWGPVEICSRSGFWCWKLSARFEDKQEWGKMMGPSGGGVLRSCPIILPVRLGRWKLILELRRDPGSPEMLLVVGLPPRDPYNKGLCGTNYGRGALLEVPLTVSATLHHPDTGELLATVPRNSGSVQGWPNWFRAGVIKVEGLFPAVAPHFDIFFDLYAGPALVK